MIWHIGITPSAVYQMITSGEELTFYQFLLLLRRSDVQVLDLGGSLNRCVTRLMNDKTLSVAQRQKLQAVIEGINAAARSEGTPAAPSCADEDAWCKIWTKFAKWVDHVLCSKQIDSATPPMCEIGQLLTEVGSDTLSTSWKVERTLHSQRRPLQRILQSAEWLVVVIPHAGHDRGRDSEVCSGVQIIEVGRELVQNRKSHLNRIDFLLYPGGVDHDGRDRAFSDAQNRLIDASRSQNTGFDVGVHRLLTRELERRIYLGRFLEHRGRTMRKVTAGVAVTHYAHNNRCSRSSILDSRWSSMEGPAAREELLGLNVGAGLGLHL